MAILINDNTARVQYTATSGQTTFAVPFEFFENSDLKVYRNSTLQTITTHYTLTGAGVTGGGNLTFVSGVTLNDIITIVRDIPIKRVTDFPLSGPFNIAALNLQLDQLTAMVQEVNTLVTTRVPLLAEFDQPSAFSALPTRANRANNYFVFDSNGNPAVASSALAVTDFTQAGTGAVLRTAQDKMREIVSAKDFGAVGDGVTDDRAAMLLALQSGSVVDGLGLTYAISSQLLPTSFKGLRNCNLKWSTVGAMTTQQALLFIRDLSDWFIENCNFDLGTQENTGSADDSTRNGLRITTSNPNVTFNERVRVQNCSFTGFGNGTRLSVRSCRNVIVTGNLVSGSQVAFSPDPTNDCQNGIDITQCIDAVVSNNRVYSLQTRLSGSLTKRFSRGILVTETRDSTVTGNHISFVDQGMDFSGGWDAVTNTNGNVGLAITGNQISDVYTYGIKLANVARDSAVSGNDIRRFGLAGIVLSGSSVTIADTTKNTQRINITGNHIADATGEFSSSGRGIWVAQQATSVGWPRGIQISNNTVSNILAGSHLLRCFDNEVTYDGSSLLLNEIKNCRGTGYTGALQVGFVPWRVELTGTAAQSIPTSNNTSITWDTETMDGWAGHASSSATITVALPGRYRVTFGGEFASNATGFRRAKIQLNGGDVDGGTFTAAPVNGDVTALGGSVELTLAASNTLRVDVFQTSGGNLDFNTQNSVFIVELIDLV